MIGYLIVRIISAALVFPPASGSPMIGEKKKESQCRIVVSSNRRVVLVVFVMVFCSCCYFSVVPPVTIRLVATSFALLYGQRLLCNNCGKWTRRITLLVSVLVSVVLSALGIFLLVLATNDDYRRSNFVSFCTGQALRSTPLDEHRCSILNEGVVHGQVLEIGPGPGTNFRCFHNDTYIDEYVAVEPNPFFEVEMRKELDRQGLNFPLRFVGIKGEEVTSRTNRSTL